MKNCASCGDVLKGMAFRHYCNECRPKVRALQAEVQNKVASLGLPPASQFVCVDCGKPAKAYDHRFYSMPAEVEPVCHACNHKRGPALDVGEIIGQERETEVVPTQQAEVFSIPSNLPEWLNHHEHRAITAALESTRWNATKAAKRLGITFRSMRYRLDRLGISTRAD